jgi:hypothetical protein
MIAPLVTMPDRLRTHALASTPHQRLYIRTLMTELDLDVQHMTADHRRFFTAASLNQPEPNARIDAVLCGLKKTQATALILALKAEVPDAR